MGCIATIKHDSFPAQGIYLGKSVRVCFHYDTEHWIPGKVVRDDSEEPGELIIQLKTGQFVRSVECQYSLV
jgi:hypothetical protein